MAADLTRRSIVASTMALAACTAPSPPVGVAQFQDGHPHIVIPASVGGRDCLAVLDNGAPVSGLDRAFARRRQMASLTEAQISVARRSFAADLLIDDLTELAIGTELPVSAIVGMDLFRRYAVGLMFGPHELTLYEPAGFSPPVGARLEPVTMATRREPAIAVVIDDGPEFQAVIDLGCSAPLLVSRAFAERHAIGEGRAMTTRQGVISETGGLILRSSPLTSVGRVRVAGQGIDDVPVQIMPEQSGPFEPYEAVIGLPLLRCFDVWLRLPERIWLRPTARLTEPIERRFTGLQVKPAADRLLVRHVGKASPAERARLIEGDTITAIDGQPPTQRRLREAKVGERLSLQLLSGERRILTAARYY